MLYLFYVVYVYVCIPLRLFWIHVEWSWGSFQSWTQSFGCAIERNYLIWIQDMKLHLTAKCIKETIKNKNQTSEVDKAATIIFIHSHMHAALQTRYLSEEDPQTIWQALVDQFGR